MSAASIQLLGHATFKVITPEGKIIIVDPWLIDNPFIPEACRQQDKIDLLLITHGHEDHFDIAILDIIQQTSPRIVANNACRWWLIEQGVDSGLIEPINLGGTVATDDVSITMVPAFHQSHIYVSDTRITAPHMANGFILRMSDGNSIYFAGDTALFGDMQLIGALYQPSIAVLPIGGRYTMGPSEAAYAVKLIGARTVIPFHYGTFSSLIPAADEFVELVKKSTDATVQVLEAGNMLELNKK